MINIKPILKLICTGSVILYSQLVIAAPTTLEIATILPDGTGGANALREFSKAVDAETKGEVKFKFNWGGNAGSDTDVLAKIKDGKLHGAMFAGQIMDQIAPSVREGEIPFQFGQDREKARKFVNKNESSWAKDIEKAQFKSLGFYEAGFVYLSSTKPIKSLADVQGKKIWLWPGDKLGSSVISELKGTAAEVQVQDSFKAFSDGRIEVAYAPAIAVVALQWYSKANQLVAEPVSYATGSFLVDLPTWGKLSEGHRSIINKSFQIALKKLNDSAVQDEKESLEALKSMNVTFHSLPKSDVSKLDSICKNIRKKLFGTSK